MKISVRKADLGKDKEITMDILNRNRLAASDSKRYDWLYFDNPAGNASVWLARDEEKNRDIGATAALPRQFWINGCMETCSVLSDFSMDPEYRSLGPALKLNRLSIKSMDTDSKISFAYDFPSVQMAAVHRFLGVKPFTDQKRYVRPISPDLLKTEGAVSKTVSKAVGSAIALFRPARVDKKFSFDYAKADQLPIDEEFDRLDNLQGKRFKVCGSRNRSFLSWRYAQNPLRKYIIISLRKSKRLRAYAMATVTSRNTLSIYDLYYSGSQEEMNSLVAATINTGREMGVDAIEVVLPSNSPWNPLLKRHMFIKRPLTSQIYLFHSKKENSETPDPGNWYLTAGDRDT